MSEKGSSYEIVDFPETIRGKLIEEAEKELLEWFEESLEKGWEFRSFMPRFGNPLGACLFQRVVAPR